MQAQVESLLEEGRIKLSSVVSDLFGTSSRRILAALAEGKDGPAKLAELADDRLKCSREELEDALTGRMDDTQRKLLEMDLERLALLDKQIDKLELLAAKAMRLHHTAVARVAAVPGFGVNSAQQLIAETGADAKAFPTAAQFASWVGTIPGKEESAEQNRSSRSPKGNRFLRRLFSQAAQSAVKTKGCHFQTVFQRLLASGLKYQPAVWAIAHRLCRLVWKILHDGVDYVEFGTEPSPAAKRRRAQRHAQSLRKLGYPVYLPPQPLPALPATGA